MRYPDGNRAKRAVSHAAALPEVDHIAITLKEQSGANNVVTAEIGSIAGVHTEPGTRGIFFMKGR